MALVEGGSDHHRAGVGRTVGLVGTEHPLEATPKTTTTISQVQKTCYVTDGMR